MQCTPVPASLAKPGLLADETSSYCPGYSAPLFFACFHDISVLRSYGRRLLAAAFFTSHQLREKSIVVQYNRRDPRISDGDWFVPLRVAQKKCSTVSMVLLVLGWPAAAAAGGTTTYHRRMDGRSTLMRMT